MENWKKAMASVFKKMDRQKWIVCILLGVLLLVIAIPVDTKEKRLSGAGGLQRCCFRRSYSASA